MKGWTNGQISHLWIKDFDKQTARTDGKWRLLLVDGHNSHYTRSFLEYARDHKIAVLCYPSHATHVYQGLDVVVFAPLKRAIRKQRDAHLREGESMDKSNFLTIYGKAHLQAITSALITEAFDKTGVWPFNPAVVTPEMMAPSRVTALDGGLPIPPATPVRIIARLIHDLTDADEEGDDTDAATDRGQLGSEDADDSNRLSIENTGSEWEEMAFDMWERVANDDESDDDDDNDDDNEDEPGKELEGPLPAPVQARKSVRFADELEEVATSLESGGPREASKRPTHTELIRDAITKLKSSTSYLTPTFTPAPRAPPSSLFPPASQTIGTHQMARSKLLSIFPTTPLEMELLAALRESEAENEQYRSRLLQLQASNVLNENHCRSLQRKLAHQEAKKSKKKKGRVLGSGLPVLLTRPELIAAVVEKDEEQKREEAKKEVREKAMERRRDEIKEWEQQVAIRQKKIDERRAEWEEEKIDYQRAKEQWTKDKKAGLVRGKFPLVAPKLGQIPPAIPKPKLVLEELDEEDDVEEGSGDGP